MRRARCAAPRRSRRGDSRRPDRGAESRNRGSRRRRRLDRDRQRVDEDDDHGTERHAQRGPARSDQDAPQGNQAAARTQVASRKAGELPACYAPTNRRSIAGMTRALAATALLLSFASSPLSPEHPRRQAPLDPPLQIADLAWERGDYPAALSGYLRLLDSPDAAERARTDRAPHG